MKKDAITCFLSINVLIWGLTSLLYAQNKRPMTVDDALNIVRVGELATSGYEPELAETVLMSPDGELIFYSERIVDWENNGYKRNYYMASSPGGEPKQFIGSAGGGDFKFSPDGKYLSLIRAIEEEQHVFLIPVSGGEAQQLTLLEGGVRQIDLWAGERLTYTTYKWAPDGSAIFFIVEEPLDYESREEWYGADLVLVNEGPNGKSVGRWSNLWKIDLQSKTETKITDEQFIIQDFDVSPDGNRIVFSVRRDNRTNYPFLSELYMVDVRNPGLVRLTDNRVPEDIPLWSPDGKTIAYQAPDDREYVLTKGFLWIMNPNTREAKKLVSQNTGIIDHMTWTPDGKSLLFNETHGTNTNLYRLDIERDELIPVTSVTGTLRALGFSKDRSKMVYMFSDLDTPTDLYVSDVNRRNPVRLTNTNPWIEEEIMLAKSEVIRWGTSDGWEIEGILQLPADYKEGTRIPLMVHIHGGPDEVWPNVFEVDSHIYAGLGYASLKPNVRGSGGYGDKLMRGLMGDVGGGEYEDLMSGVDHVIDLGIADPDRLGVRGWSWGGVLGSWAVTQTDRFKAASLGAMVTSWTAETGPGYNFDLSLWYIGGNHWDKPEAWRRHSSLTYIKNVTTPTLILHGALDVTSSYNQSLIFFTALRDRGVPTRLIKFPRQGHEIKEPRLVRARDIEEIRWFANYILGETWKPWQRRHRTAGKYPADKQFGMMLK